jgi:hypothetical protein
MCDVCRVLFGDESIRNSRVSAHFSWSGDSGLLIVINFDALEFTISFKDDPLAATPSSR